MTIKIGKVSITGNLSPSLTKRRVYNIVEKTVGAYVETLTEMESMVAFEAVDGTEYEVDNATESGLGYKVFPGSSAAVHVDGLKDNSSDTVLWVTPLAEVTA